jgi:AraC-like DNA-binding protein
MTPTPSPPPAEQSVGVSLVRSIVQELERTGRGADGVLAAARVPRALLDDAHGRLDVARYRELQRLALLESGDPAFGLSMGEHASLAAFGIVGHMVLHCQSLREALELCARYYRLVADADAPWFVERGGDAVLYYEFLRSTDPACNRMRAEFGMTRLVLTARALLNQEVTIRRAEFEHAEPPYRRRYDQSFGSDVRFGQPRTALVFPAALLDIRLLHHDAGVLAALRVQADRMLTEVTDPPSVARRLRRVVTSSLPDVPPKAEQLAKKLGISGRSLRRLLKSEGQTLQAVIAEATRDAACSLLADPSMTIQEAAHRLGFSEPSAFHRAFKRWTGMTPVEWRKQQAIDRE